MKHENSGFCIKCHQIIARYPGFHLGLKQWFTGFQKKHPECHVSCAGRGENDQEALFLRKATKAHWLESAHNYNCALDLFELSGDKANLYEAVWFDKVLAPEINQWGWIVWYGAPGSKFPELAHIELAGWRLLVKNKLLKPVE